MLDMVALRRILGRGLVAGLISSWLGASSALAGIDVPTTPPLVFPSAESHARSSDEAHATGWLVGARPHREVAKVADRFGARALDGLGTYLVSAGRARAFADALDRRHLLVFAEANRRAYALALESDPGGWSRGAIAAPSLPMPPTGTVSAGVIDQTPDLTRPDLRNVTLLPGSTRTIAGPHGTETASVVGAAADGQGLLGTFPGVRIHAYGVAEEFSCSDSVKGINAVIASGASAVNMSYGSESYCYAEHRALQYALASGVVPVAASGNEFEEGNPAEYPASLPHVLSIASVDRGLDSSAFSNASNAVDLSAPGEDVPVVVPLAFDDDGTVDGLTTADGTSFAAPAVTGAAVMLKAARPSLAAGQIADILRQSAVDLGPSGYDRDTGYGLLSLGRALVAPTPRLDPLEPNDEIQWVNGTAFNSPDPPIYNGTRSVSLSATVDQIEDPLDVYRVRIPARSGVRIVLRPSSGDPDLAVFKGSARDTKGRPIASSHRDGTLPDSVSLRNTGRRTATAYVSVAIDPSVSNLDASYVLSLRRTKSR